MSANTCWGIVYVSYSLSCSQLHWSSLAVGLITLLWVIKFLLLACQLCWANEASIILLLFLCVSVKQKLKKNLLNVNWCNFVDIQGNSEENTPQHANRDISEMCENFCTKFCSVTEDKTMCKCGASCCIQGSHGSWKVLNFVYVITVGTLCIYLTYTTRRFAKGKDDSASIVHSTYTASVEERWVPVRYSQGPL